MPMPSSEWDEAVEAAAAALVPAEEDRPAAVAHARRDPKHSTVSKMARALLAFRAAGLNEAANAAGDAGLLLAGSDAAAWSQFEDWLRARADACDEAAR